MHAKSSDCQKLSGCCKKVRKTGKNKKKTQVLLSTLSTFLSTKITS